MISEGTVSEAKVTMVNKRLDYRIERVGGKGKWVSRYVVDYDCSSCGSTQTVMFKKLGDAMVCECGAVNKRGDCVRSELNPSASDADED